MPRTPASGAGSGLLCFLQTYSLSPWSITLKRAARRRICSFDGHTVVSDNGLRRCFAARGGGGQCRELLALQPHLDHVRAAVVVVIELLAMHAVDALVDVDLAFRMDGLDRTFLGAALA